MQKISDLLINNITTLYESGLGVKTISEKLSIDRTTVSKYARIYSKQYRGLSTQNINHNFFNSNHPDIFWLLGMLASDGSINSGISISQSGDHGLETIKHISQLINYSNKIYIGNRHGRGTLAYSINFRSKIMLSFLEKYGIVHNKTKIYTFPQISNDNDARDFIRGYLDGDGCIGVYDNGKGIPYLHASIVGTKEFIFKLSKITKIKSRIYKKKGVWEIRFSGKYAVKFCNWIFENDAIYKSKKYYIFKEYINTYNPVWSKYEILKTKVKEQLDAGLRPMDIANNIGISFQAVYRWKKSFNSTK